MAIGNYGLIVDTSNFKPFTFDDLVKPFLLYKQDYEKMQDKIEKYDEEFGKLSLPEDSQYYDTLQNFKNQYTDVAQRIAEGDWARGSAEMRNLFRIARKDIAPIREATIARNKAVDDINKMRIQHPIIYDANDLKIDNFMGGNVPNIRLYNSDAIEADAAATIQAYAKAHPENPSLTKIRDGYLMLKQGGTPDKEAFDTALSMVGSEDTEGTNEYLSLLNKVLSKYDTEGSDVLKQGVRNSVIRGALKGVPATTIGVQHDQYGMNEAQKLKHQQDVEDRRDKQALFDLTYERDPQTGQLTGNYRKDTQLGRAGERQAFYGRSNKLNYQNELISGSNGSAIRISDFMTGQKQGIYKDLDSVIKGLEDKQSRATSDAVKERIDGQLSQLKKARNNGYTHVTVTKEKVGNTTRDVYGEYWNSQEVGEAKIAVGQESGLTTEPEEGGGEGDKPSVETVILQ